MPDNEPPKKPADDELDSLADSFHAGENLPSATPIFLEDQAPRPSTLDDEPSDDDLRSSPLARRLAKRRGYSIAAREPKTKRLLSSWGLGAVALLAAWALWGTGDDVRYWISGAPPVDLGHLGGYRLENAQEGVFAHVEGIASPKRAEYSRMFGEHELFPLIGSRILIDRAGAPDDSLRGYGFKYSGDGRLVRATNEGKWAAVREQFSAANELARQGDVWVLEDGLSPRKGLRVPMEVGLWAAIFLACAVTLGVRAKQSTLLAPKS
jgi:hypothetical protein